MGEKATAAMMSTLHKNEIFLRLNNLRKKHEWDRLHVQSVRLKSRVQARKKLLEQLGLREKDERAREATLLRRIRNDKVKENALSRDSISVLHKFRALQLIKHHLRTALRLQRRLQRAGIAKDMKSRHKLNRHLQLAHILSEMMKYERAKTK